MELLPSWDLLLHPLHWLSFHSSKRRRPRFKSGLSRTASDGAQEGPPCHTRDEKRIEDARSELKEGEELEVKIIAIDRKKRTIAVSIKAKESDDEAAAVEEYSQE